MAIPHLVAHRGHMEIYPENTLVGLEAALQCGASYIEFDVQCAADGTLIVLHDTELLRTRGVNGNIFEMSWDELQNIRAHEPARVRMVRDAGAREVHLRISSPPTTGPCYYGIDTPLKSELIASSHSVEEIRAFVEADSLAYLSHDGLLRAAGDAPERRHCTACFSLPGGGHAAGRVAAASLREGEGLTRPPCRGC